MSKIAVNEITDEVGTGAPAFPNGMSVTGAALTDPQITGGIFLGGTGSANKLDDYETGTWTPILANHTPSFTNNSTGKYTKIGETVFATGQMDVSGVDTSDPSPISFEGFPFVNSGGDLPLGDIDWRNQTLVITSNIPDNAKVVFNITGPRLEIRNLKGDNVVTYSADANSSGTLKFTAVYRANS
jgi:hypothetical protein